MEEILTVELSQFLEEVTEIEVSIVNESFRTRLTIENPSLIDDGLFLMVSEPSLTRKIAFNTLRILKSQVDQIATMNAIDIELDFETAMIADAIVPYQGDDVERVLKLDLEDGTLIILQKR